MRTVRVTHPTKKVAATIQLPSSKSISNRVLILQAISGNNIALENISTADDTLIMQSALFQKTGIIDVKNAGTCMRFLTAYFASINCEVELQCDERMKLRPIKILVNALRDLGADISYLQEEGFPPLKIKGKQLDGGNIKMNASVSSQFISALMLVAPIFKNGLEIELTEEISSRSYIEMTANLINRFGFDCSFIKNKITIQHQPINQSTKQPITFSIEQDWSSAAFWYEIVALSEDAEILLKDLSLKSLQGDCIISEYMKVFGVETIETDEGIVLKKFNHGDTEQQRHKSTHQPINQSTNLSNTLDLAPTLTVTAAAKNIETELSGLKNLKIKESNRLQSLETELKKCNFNIVAKDDSLIIHSTSNTKLQTSNSKLQTYNDHRLAMSFAPLALLFDDVMIENPDVVEKSYPHFWEDLKLAGFELEFNI
ncbi:MAG: 3-phosphoshikimate 1-carboxyvinyltransferase [Bacteroidota bacterium]